MQTFRRPVGRALGVLALTLALVPAGDAAAANEPSARAAALSACPAAATNPSPRNARVVRRTTLCLLNRERRRHGLKRLRSNGRLRRSATRYSRQMARRNFFSHVSPGGSTMLARIKRAGYLRGARGFAVGENLAWGSGRLASPIETVRAWMHSPGHRANILNGRFREIGIGVATGAPVPGIGDAATYTTHFGAKL